jgi:uncharacterized protein YecE (DUF72 family)
LTIARKHPHQHSPVRVGLCGFTMAMDDYALYFPVVEVQQTFYDPPPDATMQRWLASTPRSLEYTLKAWQLITHAGNSPTYRRLKSPLTADERASCGAFRASPIVERGFARSLACARLLGATAMLFQCPASFLPTDENIANLRAFFRDERRRTVTGVRYLFEPRGRAWVEKRAMAVDLCNELGLVHVVDPLVTPPALSHPVYWRLHGVTGPRHVYSDAELAKVAELLAATKPEPPAYVMFNNMPRVGDAKRFLRLFA